MSDSRWPAFVLSAALLPLIGCGRGGPSTSRAYDHFVAAATALEAGDKEAALVELTKSIEKSPTAWAYFERARLYLDQDHEELAVADCQKGLELEPTDRNLKWLSGELQKRPAQRFKGPFAKPPGLK